MRLAISTTPTESNLLSIREVLIASRYGMKQVIKYRKEKSLERVKILVINHEVEMRKKEMIKKYPHLFGNEK